MSKTGHQGRCNWLSLFSKSPLFTFILLFTGFRVRYFRLFFNAFFFIFAFVCFRVVNLLYLIRFILYQFYIIFYTNHGMTYTAEAAVSPAGRNCAAALGPFSTDSFSRTSELFSTTGVAVFAGISVVNLSCTMTVRGRLLS